MLLCSAAMSAVLLRQPVRSLLLLCCAAWPVVLVRQPDQPWHECAPAGFRGGRA